MALSMNASLFEGAGMALHFGKRENELPKPLTQGQTPQRYGAVGNSVSNQPQTPAQPLIRIAEQGACTGPAEIDIAEIRGVFDGTLTVRQKLVIYATGKVAGKIRYGKVVIEEGGQLSGDIECSVASAAKAAGGTSGASTTTSSNTTTTSPSASKPPSMQLAA